VSSRGLIAPRPQLAEPRGGGRRRGRHRVFLRRVIRRFLGRQLQSTWPPPPIRNAARLLRPARVYETVRSATVRAVRRSIGAANVSGTVNANWVAFMPPGANYAATL